MLVTRSSISFSFPCSFPSANPVPSSFEDLGWQLATDIERQMLIEANRMVMILLFMSFYLINNISPLKGDWGL